MAFLKVAPWKGVIRFKNREKLNLRHFEQFWILERIGPVAYCLELPLELNPTRNVFHISMLRKYIHDPSHVLEAPTFELQEDLSFKVQLVDVNDREMKRLRSKVIPMVKVLWRSDSVEEMTWETEVFLWGTIIPIFF